MRGKLSVILLTLAVCLPQAFAEPRAPVDKRSYARLPEGTEIQRVVVKFHEGTAVRLRRGLLTAQGRDERNRRDLEERGLSPARVESDVAEVQHLAALAPEARGIRRLLTQDEEALAELRARGEARSGRRLADLDLYYELRLQEGTTAGEVAELLDALNSLPSVEIAYAQPPAQPASLDTPRLVTAASATPDFQSLQGYLNPAPQGVNAHYAWSQAGGQGQNVKIVDIEGGWQTTHEDMPALFHTGMGQSPESDRSHGTAVLGVMVGKNNGFGVTGIVPQAQAGYESIDLQSLPSALMNAAGAANAGGSGGIVLIELHYPGPASSSPCACNSAQCHLIPAEYFPDHFDAIAILTANGTVVVEAAGNGSTNLDDPVYANVFQRSFRDSGAILVAASNSFNREAACWTNFGSRIDLHGWGNSVTTMGYGDLFNEGGPDRWYTSAFAGTSSASPIVAGAAASLQGRALATLAHPLDPLFLRNVLRVTGTPYTGGKNIGPLPNLSAAFIHLANNPPPPPCYALTLTHSGTGADPLPTPGSSSGCASGRYRAGTAVSLSAAPGSGWRIAGWSGTSNDSSTLAANSLTMPAAPHLASVTYEAVPDFALSNNVARSDSFTATGNDGTWRFYYVDVEPWSTGLVVDLLEMNDDADLFLRHGAKPGLGGDWDCRSSMGGRTDERCAFEWPAEGRWWIGVFSYYTDPFTYKVKASWTIPTPPALDFYSVAPCRAVDTRTGSPLASEVPRAFQIAGTCGVPASAKAVAVNVTAVNASGPGSVTLWPTDLMKPPTSVLSFRAGGTRASNAILGLATNATGTFAAQGSVAGGGAVHLVVDVTGYFE